jgi:hypothetical protein
MDLHSYAVDRPSWAFKSELIGLMMLCQCSVSHKTALAGSYISGVHLRKLLANHNVLDRHVASYILFMATVLLVVLVCTLNVVSLPLHCLISVVEIKIWWWSFLSYELRLVTSHKVEPGIIKLQLFCGSTWLSWGTWKSKTEWSLLMGERSSFIKNKNCLTSERGWSRKGLFWGKLRAHEQVQLEPVVRCLMSL